MTLPFYQGIVRLYSDILDRSDLEYLNGLCESTSLEQSTTGYGLKSTISPSRVSVEKDLDPSSDTTLARIIGKILECLNMQPDDYKIEARVVCYETGGRFDLHHDNVDYDPANDIYSRPVGHCRQFSVVAFLCPVEEGGQLAFPKLDLTIDPVPGNIVAFPNIKPDGSTEPLTIHQAMPVTKGMKRVLTLFFEKKGRGLFPSNKRKHTS